MEIPQSPKRSNQQNPSRTNLWGAIRDIVICATEEGQLYVIIIGAVVIIIFLKISPENLFAVISRFFDWLENVFYVGWFLFLFCAAGWYYTVRKSAKKYNERIQEK